MRPHLSCYKREINISFKGEETVEKEDEEIEVIYVDDEKDNGKGEKKEMRKGKDEKGRKKEHDVITLEEEEDDDDDDFHSVRSRPSEETEGRGAMTKYRGFGKKHVENHGFCFRIRGVI